MRASVGLVKMSRGSCAARAAAAEAAGGWWAGGGGGGVPGPCVRARERERKRERETWLYESATGGSFLTHLFALKSIVR